MMYTKSNPGQDVWFRTDLAYILTALAAVPVPVDCEFGWNAALDAVGRVLGLERDDDANAPNVTLLRLESGLVRVIPHETTAVEVRR